MNNETSVCDNPRLSRSGAPVVPAAAAGGAHARGGPRRFHRVLLSLFLLPTAAIIATGVAHLRHQVAVARETAQEQLSAIGSIKAQQIIDWRDELVDDARFLASTAVSRRSVQAFLDNPAAEDPKAALVDWLTQLKTDGKYERVMLFDRELNLRLSLPEAPAAADPLLRQHAADALRATGPVMTDLHGGDLPDGVHMDLTFPVFPPETGDAAGARPIAVVVLRLNPHAFLYPLLQSWPVPSRTAETLLIRREGDRVLYLNDLRHGTNTAMNLSFPLDQRDLPAAIFARGSEERQVLRGPDYRGVPVLAEFRRIPDSPWMIGAKVDQEEIFAPLRHQAWATGIILGLLTLAVVLALALLWRQQSEGFLRRQLALERERGRAEDRSRESEEHYRSLFENMLNGFAYCRMIFEEDQPRDFVFLSVNKAFETLTGLKNVVGKKVSEVIPGIREDDPGLFQIYGRVARTGAPERFETRVEALKNWFSIAVYSPGRDHFVAVFDVITERIRAEEALRKAQQKYHDIFANTIEGIYQSTPDGRILSANRAMATIHGYASPDEFMAEVRDSARQLYVDPGRREEFKQLIEEEGRVTGFESHVRRKDGRLIWISANARAVRDDDGRILFYEGTVEDITERKRAEEAIRELNQTLERRVAERTAQLETANEELEAFSYSVSHDLRAPLRAIDGFANILTEDYAKRLDDEGRRTLDVICNEARRMGELIDDLLAFSRMARQAKQSVAVDMEALARGAFAASAAQAPGRDIRLKLLPLPPAHGDPAMLQQVFANLLSNAVKYTRPRAVAEIEVGGRVEDGECVYHVKDNGVGFDAKYVHKLFGVFQRLHTQAEFEGTGVGLALVRRVIHRHNGRVWAEAAPGQGATFHFTLPHGKG